MQQKKNTPRPIILTSPIGRMFYIVSLDQAAKFLNRVIQRVGGPSDGFISPEFVKSLATAGLTIPTGWLQGWKIEPVETDADFDRMIDYALGVGVHAESSHSASEHTPQITSHDSQDTEHVTLNTQHITQEVRLTVEPTVQPTLETTLPDTVADRVAETEAIPSILRAKPSDSDHAPVVSSQLLGSAHAKELSARDKSALRALWSDCQTLTDGADEAEEHARFVLSLIECDEQREFFMGLVQASKVEAAEWR